MLSGQFGTPQVSLGGFIGVIAAVIGGMIESLGDYFACAKLAGAPPPPRLVDIELQLFWVLLNLTKIKFLIMMLSRNYS